MRPCEGQDDYPEVQTGGEREIKEDCTLSREMVSTQYLQIFKVVGGVYGATAGSNTARGIKNTDEMYAELVSNVAAKPSTSTCYYFEEVKDWDCGRLLVPEDMYREPPALIKQLMEHGPKVSRGGLSDAEILEQMGNVPAPKRRRLLPWQQRRRRPLPRGPRTRRRRRTSARAVMIMRIQTSTKSQSGRGARARVCIQSQGVRISSSDACRRDTDIDLRLNERENKTTSLLGMVLTV